MLQYLELDWILNELEESTLFSTTQHYKNKYTSHVLKIIHQPLNGENNIT